MPMYAYACKDCGHAFDIQQSFSDDSLTVCPECGGVLRKKFNSVGVVFKGSGFYRNDSRDTRTSAEAGAPTSSEAPAASQSGQSGPSTPSKGTTTSDSSAGKTSSSAASSGSKTTPAPATPAS